MIKKGIITIALVIFLIGFISAVSPISVSNLQPSWTASGGGGVFSAYIGPPAYGYVSPGKNEIYGGREAGIIKAGLTPDPDDGHYWDEGLFGFKPTVTINTFSAGTLTYDVNKQEGTNPVWMTIEIDTGVVDDGNDNTVYQFVPTTNPSGWHTVNAGAGLWQKWDDNMGTVTEPAISLSNVATAHTGLNVVRTYLRLGMGDSYHGTGLGTIAWVDKTTIGGVTYDFVVPTEVYVDDNDLTCGGNAPCFDNIQDAIDIVAENGIVHVAAGNYAENVIVNKRLILQGAGSTQSILNAGNGIAIDVTADNVAISGFEIKHGVVDDLNDIGIRLNQNEGSTIQNNKINYNSLGLQLLDAGNNDILDNVFNFNAIGIHLEGTTDGLGHYDGGSNGPFYSLSLNNNIERNSITNSQIMGGQGGDGIYVDAACEENTIKNNTITGNAANGYYAWKASKNIITKNTISNNINSGIHLMGSSSNTITGNTLATNTNYGLLLRCGALSTTSNTITNNTVSGSKTGIELEDDYSNNNYVGVVTGNTITRNSIFGNTDYGLSVKNVAPSTLINAEENYWGDCTGPYNLATNTGGHGNEVSNNVDFTPWIGICINNMADVLCGYELSDVDLSADITSFLDINKVWF